MTTAPSSQPNLETLNGVPPIDVSANVQAALGKGRRATGIAAETAALRLGPGKLSPQEYIYYRLWDERLPLTAKKAFVGKMAQHPMHVAAGSREWFAASADKNLFQSVMAAARLRTPETLTITQAGRHLAEIPTIADADSLARFLCDSSHYPLFAKQVAGRRKRARAGQTDAQPAKDRCHAGLQGAGDRPTHPAPRPACTDTAPQAAAVPAAAVAAVRPSWAQLPVQAHRRRRCAEGRRQRGIRRDGWCPVRAHRRHMARPHRSAFSYSEMSGRCRRSSMIADSSPSWSNTRRIDSAVASSTQNMSASWEPGSKAATDKSVLRRRRFAVAADVCKLVHRTRFHLRQRTNSIGSHSQDGSPTLQTFPP